MRALHDACEARFELFTTTPRWFYDESVEGLYAYHEVVTDVGLAQPSALEYDLDATLAALDHLLPFDDALLNRLADEVRQRGCVAVICDIAPLGIAVAERAEVPSILVESFLWPWLYEPLTDASPALGRHADEMRGWFARADLHLQTEPLCERHPRATVVLPPMARPPRCTREEVRSQLGIAADVRVVVLTMGGVPEALPFLDGLREHPDIRFLVTGTEYTVVDGNLHLFDNATRVYMPDFMAAADAVVAKLGYSTIAEAWALGLPMAYVTRADFRETGPLRRWISDHLPGFEIPGCTFAEGVWVDRIEELLAMRRAPLPAETGAVAAARHVLDLVAARAPRSPPGSRA